MAGKKFAFESDEVSIAFTLDYGLGDCIISKKVFDALAELAPDCRIDIFYVGEHRKAYATAFYGGSKNLNLILSHEQQYKQYVGNYDLAIVVGANFAIFLERVNPQRLQAMSPALFQSIIRLEEYNRRYVYGVVPWGTAMASRMIMLSRILNKNCYALLSCNGALPIRNDKVEIPLLTEYQRKFDSLKLDNYITIYSNIGRTEERPKVKVWSIHCLVEYVARMKKRYPSVEIVQCGGEDDIKIENADRHLLTNDLELTKYILANSLLHVGCEGGLVHLATQLGTKCVVLFGASSHYFFGYDRNINLVPDVCFPCAHILPGFDTCLRGANEPPCMLSHTPQMVCEVTCNYLKHLDLKN